MAGRVGKKCGGEVEVACRGVLVVAFEGCVVANLACGFVILLVVN